MGSGGLEMPQALYGPYSKPMDKEAIGVPSRFMRDPAPVACRSELMAALLRFQECYDELKEEGQLPT